MPTISLAIQKGGSGKTTTAINLAAAMQQMGHRVLLVDLDPQANLSQSFGLGEEEGQYDIYGLLRQEMSGQTATIDERYIKNCDGLYVLPASLDLDKAELELVSVFGREHLLKRLLKQVEEDYDFIFLDCPPAFAMLTVNALVASDQVILPLQAEFLPFKGLQSFMNRFKRIKATLNKEVEILGLVLSRFDPRKKLHQEIKDKLEAAYPGKLFATSIRTNIALAHAQAAGKDIFTYDKTSNGAEDYLQLAMEFLRKIEV